MENNFFIGG